MGRKGPYLLSGEILIPGLVQSQAVNWATVGLLADPRRCWPAFPAAQVGFFTLYFFVFLNRTCGPDWAWVFKWHLKMKT
jgi:hypothetical protein